MVLIQHDSRVAKSKERADYTKKPLNLSFGYTERFNTNKYEKVVTFCYHLIYFKVMFAV